jgi:hypothetical protein
MEGRKTQKAKMEAPHPLAPIARAGVRGRTIRFALLIEQIVLQGMSSVKQGELKKRTPANMTRRGCVLRLEATSKRGAASAHGGMAPHRVVITRWFFF